MSFKNLSEVQTSIFIDPYSSSRPAVQFEIGIFNALVTEKFLVPVLFNYKDFKLTYQKLKQPWWQLFPCLVSCLVLFSSCLI